MSPLRDILVITSFRLARRRQASQRAHVCMDYQFQLWWLLFPLYGTALVHSVSLFTSFKFTIIKLCYLTAVVRWYINQATAMQLNLSSSESKILIVPHYRELQREPQVQRHTLFTRTTMGLLTLHQPAFIFGLLGMISNFDLPLFYFRQIASPLLLNVDS